MALSNKEINYLADQMPEGVKILDMRTSYHAMSKLNTWDFVIKFHPDYDRSDDVALCNDLEMILDDTWENSDAATKLYKEMEVEMAYANGYDLKQYVRERLALVNSRIYEEAIEGFIEFMKGGENG